ncbi:MAG TPA: hypothetical protein VKY22_12465 [Bradyrhizobium sp.]|nr:hypothetical protein [Bradyrhizobium sp.]
MNDASKELPGQSELDSLCLGEVQRYRLRQLVRRHQRVAAWDGVSRISEPDLAVLVTTAATPPRFDTLVRALHENSIIIVPFGENPVFDFLKSKLYAYGTIGAQGATAPHHVWWGGVKPLNVPTGLHPRGNTLYVSSFQRSFSFEDRPVKLARELELLQLESVIEGVDATAPASRSFKIDFLIRQWERANRPLLWIDPHATVARHPVLPQALGCDFAAYKWRSGQIEPGLLFFHQTEPARALLDTWRTLSLSYPDAPESFLLDQAWTLVASQRQLETAWLPDDYWRSANSGPRNRTAVVQYDHRTLALGAEHSMASRVQRARRFGRHQAPESHLVMQGSSQAGWPITVLIRDVLACDARHVAGAVEAAAAAFAADSGAFSKLEIVLCAWDEDVDSVMRIADGSWALLTDPSERLQPDAFSRLPVSSEETAAIASGPQSTAAIIDSAAVFRLADPLLGAQLKRSGKYGRSFLKRPLLQASI